MTDKRRSNEDVQQARRSEANLGQKDADLEEASEEKIKHMESGDAAESAPQKAKGTDLGREEAELEKASEEELKHMEGGDAAKSTRHQKSKSQSK